MSEMCYEVKTHYNLNKNLWFTVTELKIAFSKSADS